MIKDMLKDKSFLVALGIFSSAVVVVILSLLFNTLGYAREFAFYLISSVVVVSAIGVVTVRNMVYSGFLLVLTFVSIAGIYALLNADFLAAAQILINGGAVTIMLIFAIWLTNNQGDTSHIPYSGLYRYVAFVFVGLGLFLVLILRLFGINFNPFGSPILSTTPIQWPLQTPIEQDTTVMIGKMFFNEYLIPFEVASVILLMALIGAIVLALKDSDIIKDREKEEQENEPKTPVHTGNTGNSNP